MCSHCIPPYVEEVRKCFKEAYAEVHLQTNSKVDWQKWYYDRAPSTMQLMLGDIVLMKLDTFQGKRKVKDQWSEAEYVVVCQVTDDVPTYKVQDDGKNVKVIHCNWLFLVATLGVMSHPWEEASLLQKRTPPLSALVELTPLEWDIEVPGSEVDEALIRCLASHVLLGFVNGILWPLPSVAPSNFTGVRSW